MKIAPRRALRRRTLLSMPAASVLLALFAAGCGSGSSTGSASSGGGSSSATINAVGAENEYANVIEQIGGKYVKVSAIESNPNTDPHTFEASPSVAQTVSAASLLIENGVGYDTYMEKIEAAGVASDSSRKVINVQHLLGLPGLHPESAPLVQALDDAGGREGDRRAISLHFSPRTLHTSRPTRRSSKHR